MSSYNNNKFTGNIGYGVVGPAEFEEFNFDTMDESSLLDEIEKALIEIKNELDIPEHEIDNAIRSRRFFRMKHVKHTDRS